MDERELYEAVRIAVERDLNQQIGEASARTGRLLPPQSYNPEPIGQFLGAPADPEAFG
jgi:hypothetical protein